MEYSDIIIILLLCWDILDWDVGKAIIALEDVVVARVAVWGDVIATGRQCVVSARAVRREGVSRLRIHLVVHDSEHLYQNHNENSPFHCCFSRVDRCWSEEIFCCWRIIEELEVISDAMNGRTRLL